MLLLLLICHLSVTIANPFHKYPFVFLLDVGNEELQNTHTDQIRLSVPGGSVALRYPAIGDGETIAHVRVSAIDFGTDLKANIVEGGPGYKYVVFVFMGNSGAPYDTVVTLKTISNDQNIDLETENAESDVSVNDAQVSEDNDPNDSAEDLNDDSEDNNDSSVSQIYVEKSNAELTQSSSNVYAYAQKDDVNIADFDDDTENNDDDDGEKDIDEQDKENYDQIDDDEVKDIHVQNKVNNDQIDEQSIETKDYIEDDETDQDEVYVSGPKAEKYSYNEDYAENDQQEPIRVVDRNLYEKYEALKPHLYDGVEVYSQDQVQQNVKPISEPFDDEDPGEFEQMFNDEEIHNDAYKFRDTNNNNYMDSDDPSAVAY